MCGADGSSMRSVEGLATSGVDEALGRSDATCTTYQKTVTRSEDSRKTVKKDQDFWERPKFGGHGRIVVSGAAATVAWLGWWCGGAAVRRVACILSLRLARVRRRRPTGREAQPEPALVKLFPDKDQQRACRGLRDDLLSQLGAWADQLDAMAR